MDMHNCESAHLSRIHPAISWFLNSLRSQTAMSWPIAFLMPHRTPGQRLSCRIGIFFWGMARSAYGNTATADHRDVRLQLEGADCGEYGKHKNCHGERRDDSEWAVSAGRDNATITRTREVGVRPCQELIARLVYFQIDEED